MATAAPKPRTLHWVALLLLAVSVCINYADRGNLGVAARSIQAEMHLGADQLGLLLSAFSITYALSQLISGHLIDRWNVNWVYALAFLLWSAATGITGLAGSFGAIFALRLVLGASESVAYPAYSKMIAISFPEQLRGAANAAIDAGSKLGPAIGVFVGVQMVTRFTWRGMFVIIGAGSLLWLIPWCMVAHRLPVCHADADPKRPWAPSYAAILSRRELWGTALGLFGGNYVWFFFLNWLPYYFETARHYTKENLAIVGSLPFWAIAVSSMLFGLLADIFVRRGHNPGSLRRLFMCLGLLGCGACMIPAVLVASAQLCNLLLITSAVLLGAWSSNHWALTQLIAGREGAGKWTGIQNCFGNFAGIVGQIVSGYVLQLTGSFFPAFAIAGVVLVVGVLGYWSVVGQPAEISWRREIPATGEMTYSKGSTIP